MVCAASFASTRPLNVQFSPELLLGPLGAIVVLWLWKEDLRKQRDELTARLNRILDKLEAGPKELPK